jgi:hypothetical protein
VVTRRRQCGYSLVEVTVMLAVFGAVLAIFFILTAEMRQWEKRLPVNYMRHPQVNAVLARLRKDVLDAHPGAGPYLESAPNGQFESGPKILVIATVMEMGTLQTVAWDFSKPGVVERHAYNTGLKTSVWKARGIPLDFSKEVGISAVEFEDRPFGVRIRAVDEEGQVSIDLILQPRSHIPPDPEEVTAPDDEEEEEEAPPETTTM